MKTTCVCLNKKCGEQFAGSYKDPCGYCRNCRTREGRDAVEKNETNKA